MNKKELYKILKKYRSGSASEEEKKIIDAWYEALGEQPNVDLTSGDEKELEKLYWLAIDEHLPKDRNTSIRPFSTLSRHSVLSWRVVGAGALLITGLLSVSYFVYREFSKSNDVSTADLSTTAMQPWQELSNPGEFAREYIAPDGSKIIIKPKSSVKLSPVFNKFTREVRLEGEAFFEVAHDKQRPFIVYADRITTTVLGTSFTVSAFKWDPDIVVSVKTGMVSVSATPGNEGAGENEVVLTPNQKIIFNKHKEKAAKSIVEEPLPILPPAEVERMIFEDAPIKDIFEAIEKIYGVDVEFDSIKFSGCTLTTSMSGGNLFTRMRLITNSIGAEYVLHENHIVITGEGCD